MRNKFIVLLMLVLLLAGVAGAQEATEEATAEPEATAEMTETPQPEVTEEATQEATSEATEEATQEATSEATEDASEDDSGDTDGTTYTVQRGDNLFRIALRNGLTTRQLAQANGIVNPSLIFVGQRLIIPGRDQPVTPTPVTPVPDPTITPTPTPPDGDTYVVRPGDTLYRVAVRNGTTISTLVRINNIVNPNLIFVGQRLTLPDGTDSTDDTDDTDESVEDGDDAITTFATGIEVFYSGQDVNALSSQVAQLNVEWVKMTVAWDDIEPEEGTFQWDELDAAVTTFDDAGFDILITLVGAPDWARTEATDYVLNSLDVFYGPPTDLDRFGEFAGVMAARYAGQVNAYEIWNNPNLRRNWINPAATLNDAGNPVNAGLAPVRYIDLLAPAYDAIKVEDPDAVVVTAGLASTGLNDFYNSIDDRVFFEALLDQGATDYSDALGAHLFGFNNAPDAECCSDESFSNDYHFYFSETISDYREIMVRNGAGEVPLWVTRSGWGTATNALETPPDEMAYLSDNTPDEQADYITAAIEAGSTLGYVEGMVLYNLNGCPAGDATACYYSLIDVNNAARPAFSAIQALNASDEAGAEATEAASD